MNAHGALDSFLGRLTTVLVNEAQLLGGVRSDVEFIKDEMESMNGLILHLTEAQHRDHQVRAWMKQVVGLTRDCEGNVELYVHYVGSRPGDHGLLGHLRRVLRFLWTIRVRHRIATRIRELKVRAQDVGDRRQRYGVTVPESTRTDMNAIDVQPSQREEDLRRRAVLLDAAAPPPDAKEVERRGTESLLKWLSTEPAIEDVAPRPKVRVFSILGRKSADAVAEGVYQQLPFMATRFDCKAWSNEACVAKVLADILKQVSGADILKQVSDVQLQSGQKEHEKQLISKIHGHLTGQRFLIVVTTHRLIGLEWKAILDALLEAADGCHPASAIIVSTNIYDWALLPSPYKIIDARVTTVREFYKAKTTDLLGACPPEFDDIFNQFGPDSFAMKTFLHLLYVTPNRREDEVKNYEKAIFDCRRLERSISKQVLLWCYNELPSRCRSCLLYLSVFPEGHVIRTTSLARRWVAEGLISAASNTSGTPAIEKIRSSTDEAEHCLDMLFTRGFVSPLEISAEGNIKSCTVHREVREFITGVATDVNLLESSLPPHLSRYLSVHNRIVLQKSHSDGDSKDIAAYLPALAASPQWQLLKVLDLEGCKGLAKKKNLKSICKILLLKYLSLRNTDVPELPKKIKELQCLETLDIRQTKVPVLAKKAIVLPLLKHFLAGDKISVSTDDRKSEDYSFSAVDMPFGIHRMKNLEILSHVQVTESTGQLSGIAELLRLRKLGVALHGKNAKLSDLFRQIEQLHRSLRSLSVRLDQPAATENHGDLTPPKFLERLNISGLASGLPQLVQQLHLLAKLTVTEAHLKQDDLSTIGRLPGLRCLRLLHKSYIESELSFKKEEFKALMFLLVGTSNVTNITFANDGAAPKLERIVWCFPRTACVSGLRHLPKLREFELNGDCNPAQVIDEIERHLKFPVFKHNPNIQKQEDIAAASASSSSAP